MISLWQIRLDISYEQPQFYADRVREELLDWNDKFKAMELYTFYYDQIKGDMTLAKKNLRRLLKLILRIILVMKSVLHGIGICLQKHLSMQKYKYTIPF